MSCRNVCMCIICMAGIQKAQKRVLSLLELELYMVATHHVCGRNWNEPGSPERPVKYSVSNLIFKIDMKRLYSMRMILKILRCIVAACWESES